MKHSTYKPSKSSVAAVKTAFEKLNLFTEAYGVEPVDSEDDMMHDFPIFLDHGHLIALRLELIDRHSGKIVQQYEQEFDPESKLLKDGNSIETLPRVNPNRSLSRRVIFTYPNGIDDKAYARYLKASYTAPEERDRDDTHNCQARDSDGSVKGGRLSVSERDLRKIVIKRSLEAYAFAEDLGDQSNVFVHRSELPAGEQFRLGQRYSAIVMSSPKGLMACSLQPL